MAQLERLLTLKDLQALLQLSRHSVWRLRRDDKAFPKPVLVKGMQRWRSSDVDVWLKRQK